MFGAIGIASKGDGLLFGWGTDSLGLARNGDAYGTNVAVPTKVEASWVAIVGSRNDSNFVGGSALGIKSDGSLWSWGSNDAGQLGHGDVNDRSSPVQVGTSSWTAITIAAGTAAAIRTDGALFMWGNNGGGQLGQGNTTPRSSPVQVGSSSWSAVSLGGQSGGAYVVAIRTDGGLFTWGFGGQGQLGDGTTGARSSPVQVGTSSWSAISCGGRAVLAIRVGGSLFAWGDNAHGQLGDSTTAAKSSPVQIGSSSWSAICVGGKGDGLARSTSFAIRTDGGLFAWGSNIHGQMGNNSTTSTSSPVQIGTSSWVAVKTTGISTIAIKVGGTLWSWGGNVDRQLGDGTNSPRSSPVQVGSDSDWDKIDYAISNLYESGGEALVIWNTFYAGKTNGTMYSWGSNLFWTLGYPLNQGSGKNGLYLTTPAKTNTATWKAIAIGQGGGDFAAGVDDGGQKNHALGIKTDGSLWAWGYNRFGQLGDGTSFDRMVPVKIGNSSWSAVSCGSGDSSATTPYSAAIRIDGALFTWGGNEIGQLGDSTTTVRSSPVQIGSSSWSIVSCGYRSTAAIRIDGGLFTWGNAAQGQLGSNNTTSRSSPVQIGTSSWNAVAMADHCLAIRIDGGLFTWGANGTGQLGDGTTTSRSSPVQVGSSSWMAVAASCNATTQGNSAAIRVGGSLFTWGLGGVGQLGDGTTTSKSSPVQVGSSSWSIIRASSCKNQGGGTGRAWMLGITVDGYLFAWGANTAGQLGQSSLDYTNRSAPIQITVGKRYKDCAAGSCIEGIANSNLPGTALAIRKG